MKPDKLEAKATETPSHIAVIRLGKVAGKIKYTLLDAADLKFIKVLLVQAKLEVDPNGHGATIFAWAGDITGGIVNGKYLHNILWEIHYGAVPSDFKVVHRNGITMDNRSENLSLVRVRDVDAIRVGCHDRHQGPKEVLHMAEMEKTIYYMAIQQISMDPHMEAAVSDSFSNRFFDGNMDLVCDGNSILFYECHFPPCVNMEKELQQYSLCGRCRQARYCSLSCQQNDWGRHKKLCVERQPRSVPDANEYEVSPIH